jgi:hypothetical protein
MIESIMSAIKAVAELIGRLIPGTKPRVKTTNVPNDWRKPTNPADSSKPPTK